MGILLAFAPFIVFALADRVAGSNIALFAGAATSAVLLLRELVAPDRTPKLLELGTLILFGGLALYAWLAAPSWSIIAVRLRVDAGLLVIVLLSLAIRRPFTLQYARERTPPEFWSSPVFLRTNMIISAAWAFAFGAMILAEFALLYLPTLPRSFGVLVIIAALYGAIKFTSWYPKHVGQEQ